jgi:light-regulated signal transduction histidine kinase (bacteriophytochrome)
MVSHDMAASFRHVSEFSRLLSAELGGGLSQRQRTHVDFIQSAASRCLSMMEQLRAFSQAQQLALAPTRQDAALTMQLAMGRLTALETSDAEVTLAPLGEVFADERLLAIAFGHLMDNAIKFRRPAESPRISIKPAHDETTWRVHISDNGLGVEPELRGKAFAMFRRLNGEDAFPGVGAGLAICRRIARRHGGDVCFVDQSGSGACVELSLPALPHDAMPPQSSLN